jgi:GNAT superfamily N-acetyltransferase
MVAAHEIRVMTADDVDAVAAAMARAFADDPLQVWVLPDAATRVQVLQQLFSWQSRAGIGNGNSYTDGSRSVGVFWSPPRAALSTAEQLPKEGRLRDLLGDGVERLQLAMDTMTAAHPHEAHWYLEGVGTDPPRQGGGLASAALAPILDKCDAEGTPAYLESTKEQNVPFYEHHGFTITGTIDVPGGGPRMWAMWRAPRV